MDELRFLEIMGKIDVDLLMEAEVDIEKRYSAKPTVSKRGIYAVSSVAAAAAIAVGSAAIYNAIGNKIPAESEGNSTSCSNVSQSTSSNDNSTSSSVGSFNSTDNNSEDQPPVTGAVYDDVFEGINGNGFTGAPMSYDEVMEMITSPLQKENGIFLDSFYLVETVRAIPYEEARELNGWTEVCEGKTVYEVRILSDLISSEEINRTEKIIVANGTVEWQKGGDPVYAPGERFTVALTKPQERCDYLQTPSSITFRYDVIENEEEITLYSRGSEIDKLGLPTSAKLDEKVITSTTQNPAHYTQKLSLNALTEFLRSDWKQRGVSSHFENA